MASTSSEFMYFVFQQHAAVFCTLLSFQQVQDQQSCLSSAYTCIYIRSLNMVSMFNKTLTRVTDICSFDVFTPHTLETLEGLIGSLILALPLHSMQQYHSSPSCQILRSHLGSLSLVRIESRVNY